MNLFRINDSLTTTKFHILAASATVVQTVEQPARSMSFTGSLYRRSYIAAAPSPGSHLEKKKKWRVLKIVFSNIREMTSFSRLSFICGKPPVSFLYPRTIIDLIQESHLTVIPVHVQFVAGKKITLGIDIFQCHIGCWFTRLHESIQ